MLMVDQLRKRDWSLVNRCVLFGKSWNALIIFYFIMARLGFCGSRSLDHLVFSRLFLLLTMRYSMVA